jgi:hypothetical protein
LESRDFSQRNAIVCVRALGLLGWREGISSVGIAGGIAFTQDAFRPAAAFASAFSISAALGCAVFAILLTAFSAAFFTPSFAITVFHSTIVSKAMKPVLADLNFSIMLFFLLYSADAYSPIPVAF